MIIPIISEREEHMISELEEHLNHVHVGRPEIPAPPPPTRSPTPMSVRHPAAAPKAAALPQMKPSATPLVDKSTVDQAKVAKEVMTF